MTISPRAPTGDVDAELRAALIDVLSVNGLELSGGTVGGRELRVVRDGGQATDADRRLIMDWSTRWARVATIDVSAPVDLEDG